MKKIAIVSTLPPINTSLSEYGKFLVEGLLDVSEDTEIHVLADIPDEAQQVQEMSHERLTVTRTWAFNAWSNPLKLLKKLFQIRPDVVIFNLQFASFGNQKIPAMLGLTTPMLARKLGFKVITVMHNMVDAMALDEPYFSKNKLDRKMIQAGGSVATRLLLQSSRLVVTLEKYKEILQKKYKAHNVEVIGLGSYIKPAQKLYHQKKNSFLTFGKFGTYKKLEFLLDAFEELSQENPDIELVIGGTDHPNTPGYMKQVEARYAHLNNVKFIGWIDDDELPNRIREAKALILSYESTAGSSGPLHLALSQGKPVVAPNFGDFLHVANNEGVEVLFYKHRAMNSFKDIMQDVISNQVNLKKIGRHNLNVAKLNSNTKTSRKYYNLICELTESESQERVQDPQTGRHVSNVHSLEQIS